MKQARFITEGAALLAIYVMLLFISMYVPILGTVVTFALPLPFILLTIRYKLSNAFVILRLHFNYCFVSQPIGLVKTVVFGLMGIVLGYMYKTKKAIGDFNNRFTCILNQYYAHLCCQYKVF